MKKVKLNHKIKTEKYNKNITLKEIHNYLSKIKNNKKKRKKKKKKKKKRKRKRKNIKGVSRETKNLYTYLGCIHAVTIS